MRLFVLILSGLCISILSYQISNHFKTDDRELSELMEWFRIEFNLSDSQYKEIKQIHTEEGQTLDRIFAELVNVENEVDALEHERVSTDEIDFISFNKILNQKHNSEQNSKVCTYTLLNKVAKVLNPDQRKHYTELIAQTVAQFHGSAAIEIDPTLQNRP
jgi:Spy/CpxP family protein refolding chaperone